MFFHKTWIEISKKALVSNLKQFRKLVGNRKILSVVKSNAYGHGLGKVIPILSSAGTDWFGVDNVKEALVIRELGVTKPILLLGYTPLFWLPEILKKDISITVYNKETLNRIVSLKPKRKIKVHLKVETGMNRQGIFVKDLSAFSEIIRINSIYILLEGLSTHFSDIKRRSDLAFSTLQLKRFNEAKELFERNGCSPLICHTAATSAVLVYPETYFDMVRIGIGLYGLWPSEEVKENSIRLKLYPVLTWKSMVAQIKEIDKGESVGYGRTWIAKKKTKIAIVPVGYYDGFDRKLSNRGRVLIKAKFAPVIGRISMNMMTVDITNIDKVQLEDEVILIGKSGNNEITAEELAKNLDTINYEVVARINSLIPRVIV